jgi:hypothetical protein
MNNILIKYSITINKMYKHKKMSRKLSKKRTSKSHKTNKHIKKVKSKRRISKRNTRSRINHKQRGGFANCNLATVQEPEFNLPALGDIAGLNIAKSRGVIYRPDCKPDTYQAMIP